MTDQVIISVRGLRKEFRVHRHREGMLGAVRNLFSAAGETVAAVADVSFDIKPGEFVGYVGPNGAGKSTTIKALTGILVPTAGVAEVCGLVPWKRRQEVAAHIGVVFGQRTQLWWDLPPVDAFGLLGKMYRVGNAEYEGRLRYFTAELELGPLMHKPVRKLSLGERMRCELTAAMLHGPKVLFLDEPTIGLDVVVKDRVRAFLRKFNRELGTTIVLTTHDLGDIEQLCSRVVVLDKGRIVHDGGLDALRRAFGGMRRLVADVEEGVESGAGRARVEAALPPGARLRSWDGRRVEIEFDGSQIPAPKLIAALVSAVPVADLSLHDPDIESVVKRLYAGG